MCIFHNIFQFHIYTINSTKYKKYINQLNNTDIVLHLYNNIKI